MEARSTGGNGWQGRRVGRTRPADRAHPRTPSPRAASPSPARCAPWGHRLPSGDPAVAANLAGHHARARAGSRTRRRTPPGCAGCRPCRTRSRAAPCRRPAPPPSRRRTRRPSVPGRTGCRWRPTRRCACWRRRRTRATLVLPSTMAPGARRSATSRSSSPATRVAEDRAAPGERQAARGLRSFTPSGRPCSTRQAVARHHRRAPPCGRRRGRARSSRAGMALTAGSTRPCGRCSFPAAPPARARGGRSACGRGRRRDHRAR